MLLKAIMIRFLITCFYLLSIFTVDIFSQSGTVSLGSQITNGITTGGCISGCITPGTPGDPGFICDPGGSGNHSPQTLNYDLIVPPGQYATITATTSACNAAFDGLDVGDFFIVNGVTIVTGSSNNRINYTGCFENLCSAESILTISLIVDRRDETVSIDWTVSHTPPVGSCTTSGTPQTPTFNQVPSICPGEVFTLPVSSLEGITGTWSPALNNMATETYVFTPDAVPNTCYGSQTMTVTVNPLITPTFTEIEPVCQGSSFTLPLTSTNGITGTWSPAINNLSTTPYTFTPDPILHPCAGPSMMTVEIEPPAVPALGPFGPYCSNGASVTLPLVQDGITGTWSGAILTGNSFNPSVLAPGIYTITFNPAAVECAVPGEISISLVSAPQINTASLNSCDADQDGIAVFDLTSVDNIVTNNIGTNSVTWFTDEANLNIISVPSAFSSGNATVYARVTNPDGCSATVPVTLTLDPPVILNLTDFSSCINGPVIGLPVVVDGYAGVWSGLNISGGNQFSPAGLNTGAYPITFSPTGGFCVAPITVNVNITSAGPVPLNSPIATTCSGDASAVLSNQQGGISGVWSGSPFLTGNIFNISASGAGTFTVTFTPNGSGSCFSPNTTQVVVIPNTVLTPVNFSDVCSGSSIINLGTVVDGETGNWSGNSQIVGNTFNPNTTAGDYPLIFTPTKNCVTGFTTNIKVLPFITLTPPALGPTCVNGATIALPSSINSVSGTWTLNGSPVTTFNPGTSGTGNFTLNFTPDPTACALPFNTTISVGQINAGKDSISTLCSIHQDTINLNNFLSAGSTSGGEWKLNNLLISNPTKYSLATLSAGNHIFSYILNDVSCGRDTALITFNITFPNNAGNNSQSILCSDNTSSVDFNSLLGTHGSGGTWTQPFGSNMDLSNISNVDLSSLTAGSYEFKYILPAGICPSDTSITLFDIKTFNSAGVDDNSTLCLGTEIDLINLVNTSFIGGNIVNPSGISGLTGSIWNTSGLLSGQYTFLYVVNNPAPCLSDTSELVINLAASVSAGNDISDFFCENATLDLNSYLSSGASAGGKFFLNGVEIINGNYTTTTQSNLQFIYKVGDGLTCPEDTAFITLGPILKPGVNVTGLKDICENDCQDITIIHSIPAGAQIAISMTTSTGIKYNITNPVLNSNPINLYICPINNGPYSFNNPPIGETLSIKIENVTLQNNHCIFEYTDDYELRTIPLPTRLITRSLCKGEVFMIGNDLYSEIKPNGISVIPSSDPAKCDSLITVNLSFMDPSPVTNINTVTCDLNYSILVGSTTFNRSNPMGTVMLTNKFGCDSLISIRITYNLPSTGSYTETTCDANKVFNIGNQVFDKVNPAGNVTLPGANIFGCDSIVVVQINYLNASAFQLTNTTCDDAYILSVGGQTFSKNNPSGSVTLSGMAANGCDSIVNVNITYLSKPIGSYTLNTCDDNFTYTGGNVVFNKANPTGSFILTSAASNGCDSIVNVQINFSDFNISNALLYNCDGSDPKITLNLASHPGPYTINIDGQQIATNQNLPFTTSITSGNHTLFISTPAGCEESILVTVEDTKGPDVMLTQSPNPDGTIRINVIAPQNVIYDLRWSPASSLSCNNCFDPIANPAEKTTYTLDYKYSSDCEGQRMISVQRINTDITLPNIFSPDGDGSNDIFFVVLPENINGTVKNMAIYDRWGNQLFSAKDVPANQPSAGWSGMFKGDPVQPGVYVYLIVLQIDGKAGTDKYSGSITVIR